MPQTHPVVALLLQNGLIYLRTDSYPLTPVWTEAPISCTYYEVLVSARVRVRVRVRVRFIY